jgi:isopenicillin-N epimerase
MISTELRNQFLLRPDIRFLNFGSFGACPRPVFERYQQYQLELEQEPVLFIVKNGLAYLKESREALGKYVHCSADDIVYVTNPSYAVNIVAKSFNLSKGDEVLTTNLEYGACDRTWKYYCDKVGAIYKQQPITIPLTTKDFFVDEFFNGVTPKTKLIFLSHITSSTGLRLPIEEICKKAKEMGILTFVDGAHAPGQIPLNLTDLGVDIYTGACHKWMMTPKGSSFLYVRNELQHLFDPLVVSWGYNSAFPSHSQFLDYHQTQGTRDYSAFCTIPTAIAFMEKYDWPTVAEACRKLTHTNAIRFCELVGASPIAPISEDFLVQLYSIPIQIKTMSPEALHDLFFEKYHIEIPVMRHNNQVYLRYSIQAFNTQEDLDALYNAVTDLKNAAIIY